MVPPIQFTNASKKLDPKRAKYYLRRACSLKHACRVTVALSAALLLTLAPFGSAQVGCSACSDVIPPKTPLNDLGQNPYLLKQGGLYPGGYNQRPITHEQTGLKLAGQIGPLGGKIVMISIGMCNTTKEFGGGLGIGVENGFQWRAMHDKATKGNLVLVDCAQAGQDAKKWARNSAPWEECEKLLGLAPGGAVTKSQVQIVWLKEALIDPGTYGAFPAHATALQGYLKEILDHLNNPAYGFDHLKMVFLSPRTRAWTRGLDVLHTHSPEPQAYETGFADKWLIEDQILGNISSTPWLCWGPYLWADGDTPRSDNLTWPCTYVKQDDCVHPVVAGVTKVVDQLLAFFKTDPVATPWFLKTPAHAPTNVSVDIDDDDGMIDPGTTVTFSASALPYGNRTIAEYVWTYDDGDYGYGQQVMKTFWASSELGNPYKVHLTVIDSAGDAALKDTEIIVNALQPRGASLEDTKHRAETSAQPK